MSSFNESERAKQTRNRYLKAVGRLYDFKYDSSFPYANPLAINYFPRSISIDNEQELKKYQELAEFYDDYLHALDGNGPSSCFTRLKTRLKKELATFKEYVAKVEDFVAKKEKIIPKTVRDFLKSYLSGGTFTLIYSTYSLVQRDEITGRYGYKVPNWQEVSYSSIPSSAIEQYKLNKTATLRSNEYFVYKRCKATLTRSSAHVTISCDYGGIPSKVDNLSSSSSYWGKYFLCYYSDLVRINEWLRKTIIKAWASVVKGEEFMTWVHDFNPQTFKKSVLFDKNPRPLVYYEYCRRIRTR